MFFNELNETLSKAVNSYENLIVIGDLNIDVSDPVKDGSNNLSDFVDTFSLSNFVNKHAPLKEKIVRGNNAPFMMKELRKATLNRSRLKKKYQDWPSRENFKNWKKQKNKCNIVCRRAKKDHFKNITGSNLNSNNKFWQFVKPFLTN